MEEKGRKGRSRMILFLRFSPLSSGFAFGRWKEREQGGESDVVAQGVVRAGVRVARGRKVEDRDWQRVAG